MAFMVLSSLGYTLNMMIMFGLLLAWASWWTGAIIVVEYADRKMTEGHKPKHAFAEAALRMFWPVLSSTADDDRRLPADGCCGRASRGKFMSYFPITLIIIWVGQ